MFNESDFIDTLTPCGHYLVIELKEVNAEQLSAGGILLSTGSDKRKSEQRGQPYATVHKIGPNCWVGHYAPPEYDDDGVEIGTPWKPWAKIGDKVILAAYPGQNFPVPDDATAEEKAFIDRLRIIKDDDVLCVVGGGE